MRSLVSASSLVALMTMTPLAGHAITVTTCSTNVCYEYDNTQGAVAYFGLPTLIGDTMRFLPANFRAESLNTQGVVSTSSTWLFTRVYSVSGAELSAVMVTERGDYSITGDTGGAPDTVSANLFIQVANNASLEFVVDIKNFSASGNTASPPQLWSLSNTPISPESVFTAIANDVAVLIQNTLTASSDQLGGNAWIQKKFILDITAVSPTVVPVPAAVWLFGSAFGVLTLLRRRAA